VEKDSTKLVEKTPADSVESRLNVSENVKNSREREIWEILWATMYVVVFHFCHGKKLRERLCDEMKMDG